MSVTELGSLPLLSTQPHIPRVNPPHLTDGSLVRRKVNFLEIAQLPTTSAVA